MSKYEWTREELAAQFERVTGDSAAKYPDAKGIDFLAWIRDHHAEQARQSDPYAGVEHLGSRGRSDFNPEIGR